jgi:hypothetical protein
VLQFIAMTTADEEASGEYLRTCYNLLGDLASTYKDQLKPLLLEPSITRVLGEAKRRGYNNRTVVSAAKYARQVSDLHDQLYDPLLKNSRRDTGCESCNYLGAISVNTPPLILENRM